MKSSIKKKIPLSAKEIVLVVCIVFFAGIIRIPSLTQPLGPDQGIMSVIGEGILNGELPYRDYWEMGSPAIFFTYALMFKIFGISMMAIPLTDTLVSMLTTLLIFFLARSIWDKKAGYTSALLYAFFSNGVRLGMHAGGEIAFGTFWYISQRETFILPLIVASFYFLLEWERKERHAVRLTLSGFLAGLAFVYKFPSLIIFLCLIFYLNLKSLFGKPPKPGKNLWRKNIFFVSGFIFALLPFGLLFAISGALDEMVNVIFKYVFSVYGQLETNSLATIKMGLLNTLFIAKENFFLWVFSFASCLYIIAAERLKENVLVVLWALGALLFVASHREFFGYHYLVVLPPFALLSGYGWMKALGPKFHLRKIFASEPGKAFIIFALLANLVFFTALNYMHYTKFYYYSTGKITQEEYYQFFNAYPKHDYSFPADYKVARYITQNTDSDDFIYTLGGIESVIHFLSKRKSPSRFIFSWIIFSSTHGQVRLAEIYRKELLEDLKSKKPQYIVTVRSLEDFQKFSNIYHFINANYSLEKIFPDDRFLYVFNPDRRKKI